MTTKKIPKFKNIKEEAKFWDTHDAIDYLDEMKLANVTFELDKPRGETLVLRIQKDVKNKLKIAARKKGLNVSTLARMWLMEKLQTAKL